MKYYLSFLRGPNELAIMTEVDPVYADKPLVRGFEENEKTKAIDDILLTFKMALVVDDKVSAIPYDPFTEGFLSSDTYAGAMFALVSLKQSQMLGSVDLLNLYDFYEYNNYFASRGYFITEDNKEEKYIEILGKSDEQPELLTMLEKFLVAKDKLNRYTYIRDTVNNIREQLELLMDPNDRAAVNAILLPFIIQ